jgi:hypothetical protein
VVVVEYSFSILMPIALRRKKMATHAEESTRRCDPVFR